MYFVAIRVLVSSFLYIKLVKNLDIKYRVVKLLSIFTILHNEFLAYP